MLGAGVRLEHFAGSGVELTDGCAVSERDVHLIVHGDKALADVEREVAGPAGKPRILPLPPSPSSDRHLPKQDTVEGVAGNKEPLVGERMLPGQADRRFVHDGKKSPARGDQRAHARVGLVRSQPHRPGYPPVVLGRADDAIPGDGVSVGPVKVVRPLVDFRRPRVSEADPRAAPLHDRDLLDPERPQLGGEILPPRT